MKKTILSFLCIGSTCMLMAQQTRPVSDPNLNKTPTTTNSTTQPNTLNNQNNSLNNSELRNDTINGIQADPAKNVNGQNTMDENRNPTGTPANSANQNTMNGNSGTVATASGNASYSVTVPASVQTTFTAAYPAAGKVSWHQSGDWYRVRYMENGQLMEGIYREDGKSFTRQASPILKTFVPQEAVSKALDIYGINVYSIARAKGTAGQDVYNVTVIENGQTRTEWMNEDGSTVMTPYRTETDQQSANTNLVTEEQAVTDTTTEVQTTTGEQLPAEQKAEPKKEEQKKENSEPEQPETENRTKEGINNGTGSDSLMRRMNDQTDDSQRTNQEAEPVEQ
ncbi:MAG TPA: hypothetical protein VGD17_09055 [Chitinophagaceae bacterium]